MMRLTPILALSPILSLALGACATIGMEDGMAEGASAERDTAELDQTERERQERELLGECDASAAQFLVGERATAETGQRLLQLTGARTLRWAPPNSALTMDFRADRLTVAYDADYLIERISCG